MKITKTQKIEKRIVELYKNSQNATTQEAVDFQKTIKLILICFELLSIFTNDDHTGTLKKLYLCKDNVLNIGIRAMAKKVFIQERSLYQRRKKYCEIIEIILSGIDLD